MAFLEISNLKKTFGNQTAVHDFQMNIERGEFVIIVKHHSFIFGIFTRRLK